MKFGVFGLNHNTASVELREKFALTENSLHSILEHFQKDDQTEIALVSTCNRFEMYFVTSNDFDSICDQMKEAQGLDLREVTDFAYQKSGQEALRHLLRVVCGLDSMVLGETQILGQIKDAWLEAQSLGVSRKVLSSIFERAVRLGKRIHTELNLNHHSVSVSSVAVKMAKAAQGTLDGKTVLLVGAGEMARLAVDHLLEHELNKLIIANRSVDNARKLAEKGDGEAVSITEMYEQMERADVVIASTGATHTLITADRVAEVMAKRPDRPLVIMDICVPRNVDPEVNDIQGVQLFDIDSIQSKKEENEQLRKAEADKIAALIQAELDETTKVLQAEMVTPLIKELQSQAESIQQETMKKIKNKIPNLDDKAYDVVNRFSNLAIKKILNSPIKRLREITVEADEENLHEVMNYFADFFELEKVNNMHLQQLVHDLNQSKEIKKDLVVTR